jgi:peptide/nickel transport system substrate-binding protein
MTAHVRGIQWVGLTLAALIVVGAGPHPLIAQTGPVIEMGLNASDVGQLDPHRSSRTNDVAIVDAMFNGLVRFPEGSIALDRLEPDLAERWEVSGDGRVWTFFLRRGVQFHQNYGELTADDVVFSLQKAADPRRSAFSADYGIMDRVEAVGRYTVRLHLKTPASRTDVLGMLANYHGGLIVSKRAVEELGDRFVLNPVGTGPFAFREYAPQRFVILERHDRFFRGRPRIARLVYRYMVDVRSRQLAFERGELQVMDGIREQWWVDEIKRKGNVVVEVLGPGEMRTLHLNMTRKPLDDLRVRQAISYAINRREIIEFIGSAIASPAYAPVPPGYFGSIHDARDIPRFPYDPSRAKRLLAEAGYPNGLSLGVVLITNVHPLLRPMEMITEQLRRAGITYTLQVLDHTSWHARIRENASALVMYGAARFPTGDQYLSQFYHSRSIIGTPTAVTNFSHYGAVIPGVDQSIDAAKGEPDARKQAEAWAQAQRKILADLPAMPLYVLNLVLARKPNVDLGYKPEATLSLFYQFREYTTLR